MSRRRQENIEVKIVGGLLSSIGFFFKWIFRRKKKDAFNQQDLADAWAKVLGLLATKHIHSQNIAVMEADKILYSLLEKRGVRGMSLGDKLKQGQRLFYNEASYNAAWEAHKIRNKLAHEQIDLNEADIQAAINNFKDAILGLGGQI